MSRLLNDEELRAYGEDAIGVMKKAALEAAAPHIQQLAAANQHLRNELQHIKAGDVYGALDDALPQWRTINQDPRWHSWLREVDVYSNTSRQLLLNDAFASGDASRVLALFNGFLGAHGGGQAATRNSHVWSQKGEPRATEPRRVTIEDINKFYRRVREGFYNGKEAQKDKDEAALHAAIYRSK